MTYWERVAFYEKDLNEHVDRKHLQSHEERSEYLEWLEGQYAEAHQYDYISEEQAWDLA